MNEQPVARLPLTTAQRGLWVGQKLASAQATLNIAEAVEIHGPIDPALFQRALRQFTAEAEATRVRIVEHNGLPCQIVRERYEFDLPYFDLSAEPDPRASAERWMYADIERPVDLAHDPLWASALFKLGDGWYCWYQRAHHTVYDGYSGGMTTQRVDVLYRAYAEGREPPPAEFGSLAWLVEAESAYRASDRCRRDREFWLEQLAGLPEAVTLARRRVRNDGGLRRASGHVPEAGRERLAQIAREAGVSLPQVLIALIAAYYHRASGAEDLVFGMPVTGRVNHGLRNTPGMVANVVPIRLRLHARMRLSELFAQVSRVVKQALRHQQYRYEDLRRDLGLHEPGQHLAWLGINIEPYDYGTVAGHRASGRNLHNGSAEDLTVFVFDRLDGQGLSLDLDANPTLYPAHDLDAHRDRLMRLIEQAMADPELALGALDVLGADERERLLTAWNDTDAPLPAEDFLAQFRRQAARRPQAVAAIAGEQRLRYGELDARSDRLARRLRARGVAPGDLVAIALPRETGLLTALLAVWKAGAAYLPLDPDAPMARVEAMLEDAAPRLLLTTAAHAGAFAAAAVPVALQEDDGDGDGDGDDGNDEGDERPLPGTAAGAPAYVIYTSGSTGRPKGVAVAQRNLCNFLLATQRLFAPNADDRFLAQTTIAFDIACFELFLPLSVGACVVMASAEVVRDPLRLGELIAEHRLTYVQATPSLWRMLLSNPDLRLDGVHALSTGEALPAELAQRLLASAARTTNLYGPTETTVWATAIELGPADLADGAAPPIGRPLANSRVYLLDREGRLVPSGSIGELYIGGACVAQGYLRRPELDAERFLHDPFAGGSAGGSAGDSARMYRSGDLARWREDGVLEYLGRADQQVKIRGHRVELGEIEAELAALPGVAEAAVALHADAGASPLLAAYLVPAFGAQLQTETLRQRLSARLPGYMLPAAYVELPALPLTASGKLDRKALAPPQRSRQSTFVAPRSPTECKLAALWQQIFGLERVGLHDHFFELGGDSLSAAELVAAFPRHFGTELPLGALFEGATIASLAAYLDRNGGPNDPLGGLLALRPGDRERPLFCLPPVTGLGWSFTGLLRHLDESLPVYALQSRGLRGGGALAESIEDAADDYIAQMRRVQPQGAYRVLGWSLGGLVAHAVAARLQAQGERVELLAMMDAYPFVAESGGEAGEAQQVRAALGFLGLHSRLDQAPRDMHSLAELLCREYQVFSIPLVQQVLQSDPRAVERVAAVTRNNLMLARRYRPGRIEADVLFFNARQKERVDLDGLLHYHPQAWQAHVGGRLEVHDIDSHHQAMLEPLAAAQIARVLRERLAATAAATVDTAPAPAPAALAVAY